ncbi:interferon a3-like [Osmerus mordax]|uniref:interferon a3-like n=1 Tax=Osmerus mordax TaxID=8014 RepID=UPI00350F95E0
MEKQKGSRSMFQVFNNKTISMLQHMGRRVEGDRSSGFSGDGLPNFLSKQHNQALHLKAEDKLVFIWHALNGIERLFSSGSSNATRWAQRDVDEFMNYLFRQNTQVHQCLKAMRPTSNAVNKKMKLHFRLMKKSLKNQGYSASAWEEVRRVVLAHLLRLDVLAARIFKA